ncbi:helix-turn-helix domain-containing protein [Chryseolinea soli]|uniref:AraC family transcriptional regulator n=1 Tax=Chryseolinea soli TaxID=2321403 RepID=A0A385SSB2_9BACT|nr:helix-turn-helix domain-containing protein [Chryseolinea soli]AYB33027.1 AraC family transcriptional regulator [Chryseolinea soli]
METYFKLTAVVQIVAFTLGFVASYVLWRYPKNLTTPNKYLAVSMASISYALVVVFLVETGWITSLPHLYRTGNLLALLYIPFSYLYVRSAIAGKKFRVIDLLHLVPAFLYLVDCLPFFWLSSADKQLVLQQDLINLHHLNPYAQGWLFPAGFPFPAQSLQFVVYWSLQIALVITYYHHEQFAKTEANKNWRIWLITYCVLQVIPVFCYFYGWFTSPDTSTVLIQLTVAGNIIFTAIALFTHPSILYGNVQEMQTLPSTSKIRVNPTLDKSRTSPDSVQQREDPAPEHEHKQLIDAEKALIITTQLKALMLTQPYLRQGYSLQDLSNDLRIPAYQLSSLLNRYLGVSFNDYLNQHRIEYCMDRMKKGDGHVLTLEGLAYDCGFSNRNSFTTAFKKFAGLPPSEYLREIKSLVQLPSLKKTGHKQNA